MLHLLRRSSIHILSTKHKSNPMITTQLPFLHKNSSLSQAPHEEEGKPNKKMMKKKKDGPSSLTVSYLIDSCGLSPQSALSASKKIELKNTEKPDANLAVLRSRGFSGAQITKLISRYPQLLLSTSSALRGPYEVNSGGLSPQAALPPSETIRLKTTENNDSVLDVLKSYGFTDAQMAKLIEKHPILLSYNPHQTIRPKLEFFVGFGYSGDQLTELVSSCPSLLVSSLCNRLKPNFEFLRSILGSNDQIARAVHRCMWMFQHNLEALLLPNIQTLECYGVPKPNIAKFITMFPRVAMRDADQFKMTAGLIGKMGFDPFSTMFVRAIGVMSCLRPSTWERKVAFYKSLGWSEEEVISAFIKYPTFMGLSEEKVGQLMDYYGNKMHWVPSFLSERPVVLGFNLEKRVIPRCSVMSVLASKGLEMRNSSVHFLCISERDFLNKYVINYQDQFPEVLVAYSTYVCLNTSSSKKKQ